jgi:lysophospholipid acyltransferase
MIMILRWIMLARYDFKESGFIQICIKSFSYLYFFPTVFAGPAFKIDTHLAFVENPVQVNKQQWNYILKQSLSCILISTVYCLIYLLGITFYPNASQIQTLTFGPLRFFAFYIMLVIIRCKYYYVWTINLGPMYSFVPSEYTIHNYLANIYPLELEFATDFKTVLNVWNRSTNRWLKDHIYKPLIIEKKFDPKIASLITFSV